MKQLTEWREDKKQLNFAIPLLEEGKKVRERLQEREAFYNLEKRQEELRYPLSTRTSGLLLVEVSTEIGVLRWVLNVPTL